MLQFPLPSYNTLVVLDHAKCQCKWKKCLKIFKNNINKMQHDGLKLWFNLMMGTILLYFKNFLCVLMAKIMAKQKKKKKIITNFLMFLIKRNRGSWWTILYIDLFKNIFPTWFITLKQNTIHKKWSFSLRFFSKWDQIRRKLKKSLETFTEEILNEKLHFLCSETRSNKTI